MASSSSLLILLLLMMQTTCTWCLKDYMFSRLMKPIRSKVFHWNKSVYDQQVLMESDNCIVVNNLDEVEGYDTKLACHRVPGIEVMPKLHRAFSVFLFDQSGKMLLQQRASDKLTFPNVWTNTCCSHQLFSTDRCEIDEAKNIRKGKVPGTIRAARRKLDHELGLQLDNVQDHDFKFLTRVQYASVDQASEHIVDGKRFFYGESEIDYILFLRCDTSRDFSLSPRPEEVQDTRFVDVDELRQMLVNDRLKWSPWFHGIAKAFLFDWWSNLNEICPPTSSGRDLSHLYSDWNNINVLS